MGLDMYLKAKKFLWTEEREAVGKLLKSHFPGMEISEMQFDAMYWRKANAIHAWFVKNVQGGEDECKEFLVDRKDLQSLLDTVKKVLENNKLAVALLPHASGFFFGNTDYDEWYFRDLEATRKRFEELLTDPKWEKCDFYYHSSW